MLLVIWVQQYVEQDFANNPPLIDLMLNFVSIASSKDSARENDRNEILKVLIESVSFPHLFHSPFTTNTLFLTLTLILID